MKRSSRASALAGWLIAVVCLASMQNKCAYAQLPRTSGRTAVYYNGYGQGYYGGYVPNPSASYVLVPNNGYSIYGSGPYGNYSSYGSRVSYGAFGARTLGSIRPPSYQGYTYYRGY